MSNQNLTTTEDVLEKMLSEQSLELFKDIDKKIEVVKEHKANKEINQMVVAAAQANVIKQLKTLLTDPFVSGMKGTLENSNLGFKTDKDDGYPISVIRTCLIEAALNGFYWHGNEFNIIAGNSYFTKDGLKNKMKRDGIYNDLKISFGIPEHDEAKRRALIKVSATWKVENKPYSIDSDISVKIQIKNGINYTTDDAVIGKANRKIRARIIEMVTGDSIPEGDADEYKNEVNTNSSRSEKVKRAEEVVTDYEPMKGATDLQVEEIEVKEEKSEHFALSAEDWEHPIKVIAKIESISSTKELAAFKKENKNKLQAFSGRDHDSITNALTAQEQKLNKV